MKLNLNLHKYSQIQHSDRNNVDEFKFNWNMCSILHRNLTTVGSFSLDTLSCSIDVLYNAPIGIKIVYLSGKIYRNKILHKQLRCLCIQITLDKKKGTQETFFSRNIPNYQEFIFFLSPMGIFEMIQKEKRISSIKIISMFSSTPSTFCFE